MDLGVAVKTEPAGSDDLSSVNVSLSTSASLDCDSSPNSLTAPASDVPDNQTASVTSGSTDVVVNASSALLAGLAASTSYVTAAPKIADSAGPFKLVVAADSPRPAVPKTSTHVHLLTGGHGQPTLIAGPALTPPASVTSPRKLVTVLPAGVRSPSHGPLTVIRPIAAAGQTRSPAKVTVLSLPKTSSVAGQFVTVVPSSGVTTAVPASAVHNKTSAMPYKVLIRPSSAVSV